MQLLLVNNSSTSTIFVLPPARVLEVVGATHKPWFDSLLGQMQDVDIIDAQVILRLGISTTGSLLARSTEAAIQSDFYGRSATHNNHASSLRHHRWRGTVSATREPSS
jgi:hypothetical protein